MRTLQWQDCREPVSEDAIRLVEERLGVRFPPDYIESVRRCDGGWPKPNHFEYPDPALGPVGTSIGRFLSLDPMHEGRLLDVVAWLSDQLPGRIIPFADEPGGDFICFDYRSGGVPSVVYWMHERSGEDAIAQLAPSFSAFLERLRDDGE